MDVRMLSAARTATHGTLFEDAEGNVKTLPRTLNFIPSHMYFDKIMWTCWFVFGDGTVEAFTSIVLFTSV